MSITFVNSSSSDAQVRAAYDDNSSYDVSGDPDQARCFVVACRVLLRREPQSAGRGNSALSLDKQSVRDALETAEGWLASNAPTTVTDGGTRTKFSDFARFRR